MAYTNITTESLIRELWRSAVYENLRHNCSAYGGYHIGQTDPNPIFGDKPDYRHAKVSPEELTALLSSIGWGSVDHLTPKIGASYFSGAVEMAAEWLAEKKSRFIAHPTEPKLWGKNE